MKKTSTILITIAAIAAVIYFLRKKYKTDKTATSNEPSYVEIRNKPETIYQAAVREGYIGTFEDWTKLSDEDKTKFWEEHPVFF